MTGVWFGEAPRTDAKKDICLKETRLHVQNTMTILGLIVNMIWARRGGGGGGAIWLFNEYENLHFDNERDIHTSPGNDEKSGYGLDLDLLLILY